MTSLRDIKAKYAGDTTAAEPAATDDQPDEDAEDAEDPAEEKPKPAAAPSGEQHQPRTDAEIGEGGSLFDL